MKRQSAQTTSLLSCVRPKLLITVQRDLQIKLPSLSEQAALASRFSAISKSIGVAKKQLSQLDSLVKSRFVEMFGARDFPRIRLDKVADVQGGLTKNSRRETLPMQLPYLRVANVGPTGGVDTSEMLSIGLTGVEARKTLLKADDLLFVEGNGSKDQIGRAAIWDGSIDPCVHQNHLIRARLHDNVLPIFALAFFSSSVGRRQITDKAASTSGLFTLSTGKIKSLELPVPPLSLQQKFAAFVAQVDKSRFAYIWSRTKSVEQALSGPSLTLVIQHVEPQTRSKYRTDVLASPSWPSVGAMLILKTPRVCVLILTGQIGAIWCMPFTWGDAWNGWRSTTTLRIKTQTCPIFRGGSAAPCPLRPASSPNTVSE